MEQYFDHKAIEKKTQELWSDTTCFDAGAERSQADFSMFMIPPNASGPMHIGNALMIALQDIVARYHRAAGKKVLWVPGFDHGGYETQVTYERQVEASSEPFFREEQPSRELFNNIKSFVAHNKRVIEGQIRSLGASVDWSHARYTMDDRSLQSVNQMFLRLVQDNLIVRKPYMMNYCPECATVLADIELKKKETKYTSYTLKLPILESDDTVELTTEHPEFLFTMTHVLVHPEDLRFVHLIGREIENPITGDAMKVISSKRKLSWHQAFETLTPFYPSFVKFDYEYAIRNDLPAFDVIDWNGYLKERYPGQPLNAVCAEELSILKQKGILLSAAETNGEQSLCKKGHVVSSILRSTWFLDVDGESVSIRKQALSALEKQRLHIHPGWRKKGLVEWIGKLHDWPIARQNVWGISMPIWYEINDPAKFLVWFFDRDNTRHFGKLSDFLEQGVSFEEIRAGLQRVYAEADVEWTIEPKEGTLCLPETDTFDTWFSSGAWSVLVYQQLDEISFEDVYPSDLVCIGHDLLRLSIARKVMLSVYLTDMLPCRTVYFHPLLLASDGEKMSKSLGNAVDLDEYVAEYGADVTRMTLVSYSGSKEDFILDQSRVDSFTTFTQQAWELGELYSEIISNNIRQDSIKQLENVDVAVLKDLQRISNVVSENIEKYHLERAQKIVIDFLPHLYNLIHRTIETKEHSPAIAFLRSFNEYLVILHPFAPHVSEAIFQSIQNEERTENLLAQRPWPSPKKQNHHSKTKQQNGNGLRDVLRKLSQQ